MNKEASCGLINYLHGKLLVAKLIFAGTPEFAATSLAALLNSPHQIIAVYTQPDRPAGRGLQLIESPVKQLAQKHRLPLFQPATLKDPAEQEKLQSLAADLMVVAAYGLILPVRVLKAPLLGCINIHASLLPRWRGAAPIQRAILAGDAITGITLMQMDEGLDTGDILIKAECPICPDDTSESLYQRLSMLGAQTLVSSLDAILSKRIIPQPQNSSIASHAAKILKKEGQINWQESTFAIERKIRAFYPWPIAFTCFQKQNLRIFKAQVIQEQASSAPGTIINVSHQGIDVATGEGILCLLSLQAPGSRIMDARDFLNARQEDFKIGNRFD